MILPIGWVGEHLRRRIVQNVQLIPERGVNFRVRDDHVMAVLGGQQDALS